MNYKQLFKLGEEIEKYLEDKQLYAEFYATEPETNTIIFYINWGDWKHEHLAFDYLVRNYLVDEYDLLSTIKTEVTEEDGSDCYSAKHYVTIDEAIQKMVQEI